VRGNEKSRPSQRRGVVAVWTAISMTALVGFAALSVDIGYLYVVRTQLQAAADAAALAGGTAFLEDIVLTRDEYLLQYNACQRARVTSLKNISDTHDTILEWGDIFVGRHDFGNPASALSATGRSNAVDVTVRCTPGSANGPVSLFFAAIFGITESGVGATARAAMDDRFAGYRLTGEGVLIPFTVHEEIFRYYYANGPDDFSYDGGVRQWGDGIREIKLFPWKEDEPPAGAGNFGTLNLGIDNEGTDMLEWQILNGATPEQLQSEFGTTELMFFEGDGSTNTYNCTGNPGLSIGLTDSVEERMERGDVIGFFLHRTVTLSGSNAVFEICNIRFGRIVEVHLTGAPTDRSITVQPAPYSNSSIIVGDWAPPTGALVERLVLVK